MAVVAVCIAYIQLTVTQCGIFIEYAIFQNYVADFAFGCGYFAVFIYGEVVVCCVECAVAVYEERYSAVFICSTYGQVVFCVQCIGLNGVCICITIFIYREFAVCCIKCAVAVYEERRSTICFCSTYCYAACCYTAACPDSAFAAADAYHCVIIAEKMNIVIQSNIIFLATIFIEAFGYSNIITIGNSTVFECFCFYIFQLAYVYCIGIISTCCNIGNLTFSVFAAYGYCISSDSYAAYTQSNTAFSRYRSTTADSNSLISRNRIFMTERNNIASVTDFVLVTHYNGIRNIVQFIVRACHEYVMATLFLITDKLVVIADNGRISLFGNSVGTADNCYSTALLFSENRIVAEQNIKTFACANIHIFIGIGNLIAGTLNSYAIRCLNGVCRAHNIISYAGINLAIFIIYSIFRAHNSCRCTLNNHIFLNSTKERNMYLSFIRSSVTVNYRISTYNSSIQAAGISISTYKSSALATADSIRAQRGSFIACMCFVAKSNTAAAIAASNNTCAITDSNRILNCRCTFTNFNLGIIRCRITSHRRSHACTGHNTCCNQHCQQFFGGAAFCAMVFSHFRNNDICVASFTPNYFKNFVHQKFLPHKYYYLLLYATPAACGNKLNNYCINCPEPILLFSAIRCPAAAPGNKPSQNS